ncbi:MAG: HD domain-containing protein, partial [Clostridia bacterium]|nr:HD domain-containing protein [Clostridia bacterium]
GCVRDDMMGIRPHDYDITTNARPEEIKRVFSDFRLVLDGEKHGTVSPVIDGSLIEITTFRADGDYSDGRHPDSVSFSDSLLDDLKRRDFTINAMAWSKRTGLVDPHGGADDLERKTLRAVGEPEERFREDALRILRGMRFASRLGFPLEQKSADAMHKLAPQLELISRERIFTELTGVLQGEHAMRVLSDFHDVLFTVVPELFPLYMCPQKSVYHIYDVWEHTLHVLDTISPRTPLLTWCALLHDCGKPATRIRDRKGYDHYPQHQQVGAGIAERILQSLKVSNAFMKDVCTLVLYHDDVVVADTARLLMYHVGQERFEALVSLRRADLLAHDLERVQKSIDALEGATARYRQALENHECVSLKDLAVNGDDMLALGYQGPEIREILERLLIMVLKDEIPNEREVLIQKAAR